MGGQSSGTAIGGSDFTNQNKIPLGGVFQKDPVTGALARVDPDNQSTCNLIDYCPYHQGYDQNSINMNTHNGYSNYNGFQVSRAKQSGRLSYNLNYTFSRALGIVNGTVDPFTVHGNYGVLSIDRRNQYFICVRLVEGLWWRLAWWSDKQLDFVRNDYIAGRRQSPCELIPESRPDRQGHHKQRNRLRVELLRHTQRD